MGAKERPNETHASIQSKGFSLAIQCCQSFVCPPSFPTRESLEREGSKRGD